MPKQISTLLLSLITMGNIYALSGTWTDDHGCIGWNIEFKNEKEFQIYVSCMGPQASISGQYEHTENKLTFKNYKIDFASYVDEPDSAASISIQKVMRFVLKGSCRIEKSEGSVKFSEKIECKGLKDPFWHRESAPPAGTTMSYKSISIETVGMKNGKTTECVRMRLQPSQAAKLERYILVLDENKTSDCIPKGTKVRIYARTSKKDKVKDWENYWYLIKSGWHDEVWVYGEFISIDP